jgi:arylsulfatase A-like enzyme
VDTLRADHLGLDGYGPPTSPVLDRLAGESFVLEQAQAPRALTWPSLTTLLTGREVHRHGVRRNGERPTVPLRTLATALQERGYRTGAFLSNACDAELPGFTERYCSVSDEDKHFLWDRRATSQALSFLEEKPEPFFAWVHLMDPHWPFNCIPRTREVFDEGYEGSLTVTRDALLEVTRSGQPLSPADQRHVLGFYDCQIRHVDERLDDLLGALERSGRLERTLVVFTADHGEELGDHRLYYYHTASVYQSALRVPLLLRLPHGARAGRSDRLVGLVDLAPTLLDLLGFEASALGPDVEGRSFASLLEGRNGFEERTVRGEVEDRMVVLRTPRYKYVWNPESHAIPLEPGHGGEGLALAPDTEELYDLIEDPGELRNLAQALPELAAELREEARSLMKEPDWPHRAQEIDPELRERLRALGYASN